MKIDKLARAIVIAALLVCSAGGAFFLWQLKNHGFSARREPMALEAWFARNLRRLATPASMRDLRNPVELTPLALAEARDHFADHCAVCHGNRGDGKTMFGQGMYPPPPDLRAENTQSLNDGEIFNIIKEGIRFTGMPGFGGEDEENWKLVHFIRHLPKLSEKELELMEKVNDLTEDKEHAHH